MHPTSDPSFAQAVLAALTGLSQSSRLLHLHTPLGTDVLLAESLHGEEGLDSSFRLQVSALSPDAALSLRSLLGQPALLALQAGPGQSTRHFHGHVTAAELCGANGGLARYRLVIEPWTAFLALGRDSRVFQDKSVLDIIDTVFAAWNGKGMLVPAWRIDADREQYPVRSLVTQYQESDWAFVQRLMSEEGLFTFFEHGRDAGSPSLGSHTLVIGDSNDAFAPNAQGAVRFTQPGAVMTADSIDRWRTETRLLSNAIDVRSWDYRTRTVRTASASAATGIELRSSDVPGAYAYATQEHGERIAERQLQALEAQKEVHVGAGTVRSFAPGTTFTLLEHSRYDGRDDFLIVRVRHLAHSNLEAEITAQLTQRLGGDPVAALNARALAHSLHATGKRISERPVYRNSFDAIRASVPYRGSHADGHGRLLHPRPTVRGQQTAVVVGPPGTPVHTDRDHRIKVQFHWQRGTASHGRLDHPAPEGHSGAPADDRACTWVRVATPLAPVAGANWGSHALPRVGQEVLVDFIDGNIDRPIVIGAVYNGKGEADAQANRVTQGAGAATGNAAVWFPGENGGHAHAAVLSGLKSQALQSSAGGAGAYSQLVFDDSPGQPRIALQRHAEPHQGTAELNLGQLRHQADNARLDAVGFGAELKTEHSVALRAARGMLLATDSASAGMSAMEAGPALSQVANSQELLSALADTAQKHNAKLPDERTPEELPAVAALAATCEALGATTAGTGGDQGGGGLAAEYGEAQLQLSSPAGIAALTPASAVVGAGTVSSVGAGQDINLAAQRNLTHAVKAGIGLFTYGKASAATKPNQETGIRLHAASGKVSSQSQTGPTRLTADKTVTVASVASSVTVAAKDHVLLTAQGAYLRLSGGNIEVHGPGTMSFKASMKELAGPKSEAPSLPALPKPGQVENFLELNYRWDDLQPMVGAPYKVLFDNGTSRSGKLDANGFARLENVPATGASVTFGEDERDAQPRKKQKPNALAGSKPKSDEEAQRLLERYLAQEAEYYKSNFFPDEIEDMDADWVDVTEGDGSSELDYDYHMNDYVYDEEVTNAAQADERSYRDIHDNETGPGDQA
ncbi:type VI secretion system tip protein TssI/VgrG [Pseudoduganella sp. SL102]|uniref:type VI secretion system Vgr family protein n=1 Tax=Pseudoduganella sp. SL102 TaxID=2995154 RepID=UPI00248B73FA|nr:type VI secretion system Vgr family protein [Pseudoduganella sp. SL102]WBS04811.1 type VI secretion system tip protein TssI/VgrG [Pseudoduganella sp. SL102]